MRDDLTRDLAEVATDLMTANDYVGVPKSALGFSSLGSCQRKIAYTLRDGRLPEPRGPYAASARVGTAIHADLLPRLAERFGGESEVSCGIDVAGVRVGGSADLYLPGVAVVDVKTQNRRKFYVNAPVNRGNAFQVRGYARALDAPRAILLAVCRDDGAVKVSDVYNGDDAWAQVEEHIAGAVLPTATREERGPGVSIVCDSCPWVGECWGPDL